MNSNVSAHFLSFGTYTYPGCYLQYLKDSIPEAVEEFGPLLRKNIIHRVTLRNGNTLSNSDLKYGDMEKVPWWRQCEDDRLVTASAMLAELFRRDGRGLTEDRKEESKIVVTCRAVAILTATIFKAKGIPARVRSGFEPYAVPRPGTYCDHWITEYWSDAKSRWVQVDIDCCMEPLGFSPFDLPKNTFEFAAESWIRCRTNPELLDHYINGCGAQGLITLAWELIYDFHSLMNSEILYFHTPSHLRLETFQSISNEDLQELDNLAELLIKPDMNFVELTRIWDNNRALRILTGGLL